MRVRRCVAATQPGAIVHAAIWNDPAMELPDLDTMLARLRHDLDEPVVTPTATARSVA